MFSLISKVVIVHQAKVQMSDLNLEVNLRAKIWSELDILNRIGTSIWTK